MMIVLNRSFCVTALRVVSKAFSLLDSTCEQKGRSVEATKQLKEKGQSKK